MGLTRIRAEQISDIDYKQAARVVTVSNVTLSGGAPNPVDGVSLSDGDRILVTGQSTTSQNGLYVVSVAGSGSNGTWVRSTDGNENGEIEAGMIIMVTEGDVYKDTQWKLTTNNPIVIGTTALVFEQNSAYAFGNVYANGTAVLASSVGDTLTLTPGDNIAITGNNTSKTVTIGVTGISLNSISNGTSNVNVGSSGGNVTVGVGGTNDIAVFSTGGVDVTGRVSASGNVTGGNVLTGGLISATGNITGGNLSTTGRLGVGTASPSYQVDITNTGQNALLVLRRTDGVGTFIEGQATRGAFGTIGNDPLVLAHNSLAVISIGAGGAITVNPDGGSPFTFPTADGSANNILATDGAGNVDWTGTPTFTSMSATGNITGGNLVSAGQANIADLVISGNVTGNLLPSANITYNLGSTDQRWNDLWLANSTIYIGNASISANATAITLTNPEGGTTVLSGSSPAISASTVTATGNITGGNIVTAGQVSSTKLVIPAASNTSSTNESLTTASGNIGVVLTESSFLVTTNLSGIGYTPFSVSNTAVVIASTATIRNADGNVTVPSYRFGLDSDTGIYRITTNTLGIAAGGQNTAAFSNTAVSLNKDTTVTGILTATGNITAGNLVTDGAVTGNGRSLSGINSFGSIGNGTSNVTAASIGSTLTLAVDANLSYGFQTDAGNSTITLIQVTTESIFATGGDMGLVSDAVTAQEDLGLVTDAATTSIDMGGLVSAEGLIYPTQLVLPSFTVATLPGVNPAAQFIYVSDESGGPVPAFSDGTNWRRVTDRAIVT